MHLTENVKITFIKTSLELKAVHLLKFLIYIFQKVGPGGGREWGWGGDGGN
jgi:hypothetical protein